jgi:hypothetical protein
MLTGLIIGLVVGVIGAISVAMKQSHTKKKMQSDLATRGIAVQPGAGALQLPPTRLVFGAPKPPEWSAAIGGPHLLHLYGFGGYVVAAWRAATPRPGTFVVAWVNGPNPDRRLLQKVPKKQLTAKNVAVYASAPEVAQWIVASPILPAFAQRAGKERGWHLVYADGLCYLYSSMGGWTGFDDVIATVTSMAAAIG